MRTRFLNVDYYTLARPIQTLETLAFLHLPVPKLAHSDLAIGDLLRFDRAPLELPLQIEHLSINAALSRFFYDVLPQNLVFDAAELAGVVSEMNRSCSGGAVSVSEQKAEDRRKAGLESAEKDFTEEDGGGSGGDNDALRCEVLQFETNELDVFLEHAYLYEKEEIPVFSEVPEETVDFPLQYPWGVHESVHIIEDLKPEHLTDQQAYSFEDDESCLDQMRPCHIPFPMLEANEISLQYLTAVTIEDELSSVYENIQLQHLDQSENLNGKELLGLKEHGMLELLLDNCLSKQHVGSDPVSIDIPPEIDLLSLLEMSQVQLNSACQDTSIGSCFQSAIPLIFQEFQILDLDSSLVFEVLFEAQTANEPETCDLMFNGDISFNNLVISPELTLVDDTFKSLPVPVLHDHERISSYYAVIQEKLTDVKPQPHNTASDRIYLDWHLLEIDSTSHMDLYQKKMFEDLNPLNVGIYWNSFDDEKFYDLIFSGDVVEDTGQEELLLFPSDAVAVNVSTRLSGDNYPLKKTGENIYQVTAVDEVNPDKSKKLQELVSDGSIHNGHLGDASSTLPSSNLAQPKYRQHIEKNHSERPSLLFTSMSQFNDIDFFLNPRMALPDDTTDYAVTTVDKFDPRTKGEHPRSVCAQVDNRNKQKSNKFFNSFSSQEENDMRSKEDSDEVEASSIPVAIQQQSIISFPETVIVVNTQTLEKEMIVSRRSTYQKVLALEKKGSQVVERDSELPIDIILSSAVCLVWYDCSNIAKKATALDEDSSSVPLCIENIATNVLPLLSTTFNSFILIFEGDTSFLSTVMESSHGLYAAAASLGIDLQVFNSYSSEVTDEIILNCIEQVTKSIRGVFPQMPESESLAESFLTKFPSVNALSAHAILSSGVSLVEFLKWSHEKRIHAIQKYQVPDESIKIFSALCKYGERGDSRSIMTDCSSSVSSGADSGRYNFNDSEKKRRKYNSIPEKCHVQLDDSLHLEQFNIFPDPSLVPPAASKLHGSCTLKSPRLVDEFRKPIFSHSDLFDEEKVFDMAMMKSPIKLPEQYNSQFTREPQSSSGKKRSVFSFKDKISSQKEGQDAMNMFAFRGPKNSENLHDHVQEEVIDLTDGPIFDLDFSSINPSMEFSSMMHGNEMDTTRKYKAARKLSFGSSSHRTFPTAAEIDSTTSVWSPVKESRPSSQAAAYTFTNMDFAKDIIPPRKHKSFIELDSFRHRSSGISQAMHLHENDVSPYGGTQLSNALQSSTLQQNSPWTIEFLNKIKEKSRLRQQSFPRDLSRPILEYSDNAPKVTKRRSPTILEFFSYEGGNTPQKLPEQKRLKRPVPPSRAPKMEKTAACPRTALTPADKRARQTLSFATNRSGGQTKLVWGEEAHGPRREFQSR